MIAVTTWARVGGVRHLPKALRTVRRIRRELTANPDCLRFATIVAGPRQLLTLSVWTNHERVLQFVGAGSHGPTVWNRPGWLTSYWGMRARPGGAEIGSWDGSSVHALAPADPPPKPVGQFPPGWWGRRPPPGFASSPFAAAPGGDFEGAVWTTYRLDARPGELLRALRDARRVNRHLATNPAVFASAAGVARGRQVHLLVAWRDRAEAARFSAAPEHEELLRRWEGRAWWMEWLPVGETGRWDGRQLRTERTGRLATRPARLDLRLDATPDAVGKVKQALRELDLDVAQPVLRDTELVLDELIADGVLLPPMGRPEWIRVRVQSAGGSIRVELTDPGRGFAALAAAQALGAEEAWPDAPSPSGLLVQHLPDRWGMRTDGLTRVWFEIDPPA